MFLCSTCLSKISLTPNGLGQALKAVPLIAAGLIAAMCLIALADWAPDQSSELYLGASEEEAAGQVRLSLGSAVPVWLTLPSLETCTGALLPCTRLSLFRRCLAYPLRQIHVRKSLSAFSFRASRHSRRRFHSRHFPCPQAVRTAQAIWPEKVNASNSPVDSTIIDEVKRTTPFCTCTRVRFVEALGVFFDDGFALEELLEE